MRINRQRVLAGGLVAGFVISLSALAMVYFVVLSFIFGVVLVWLYAVQPRLAPGPKTAALVAVLVWFVGYCAPYVSNMVYGVMPVSLTVVGTAWGLVELVVAGAVGAYLYRDESSTEPVHRADGSGMRGR